MGSEKPRQTEARVIAATNRNLEALVQEGKFREDLYYRLKVVEIRLPRLRERPGDLELLARHFLKRAAAEMHLPAPALSEAALKALATHDWPENIRELEHTLTRAMVLARGGVIGVEHLSLGPPFAPGADQPEDDSLEAAERAQVRRVLAKTGGHKRQASSAPPRGRGD